MTSRQFAQSIRVPSPPLDERDHDQTHADRGWPRSLVELLQWRARARPDEVAYTFLDNGETPGASMSWADLDRRSRAIAAELQRRVEPGDRAVLLYPPGLDFIEGFFGCLYAGVVAVPVAPPHGRSDRHLSRLEGIVHDAAPAVILSHSDLAERSRPQMPASWIATNALGDLGTRHWTPPRASFDTVAFLQYTSGSTAAPRGVIVSHGNLLHNLADGWHLGGDLSRGPSVSWLPVTHDMGLIEGVLQPLWSGRAADLMAPAAFLQRPARWLEAISRARAVRSGGPNFAYDLCARKVSDRERAALDLSSWRAAFSGAEPVRADTLHAFARMFADTGFDGTSFRPCYGLAEATLVVTSAPWDGRHDRDVPCGITAPGTRLVIVDATSGARAPDGDVGEIWVTGPGVAGGYWRREAETSRTFHATLSDDSSPYLRTGDLGRLVDGQLVVTGRQKDLLIVRGMKHFPQDLEATVERSHPGIRHGCVAAFSTGRDVSGDQIGLVAEVDPRCQADVDELQRVIDAVRLSVTDAHGLQLSGVAIVAPREVPRTSSGKLQRFACWPRLSEGTMQVLVAWGFPACEPAAAARA